MKRKVYAKEEVCMGCHLCEVYCAVQHSKTKDVWKAYKLEPEKPVPRLIVEENKPVSFALQCRHCEDAPCVEACLTGAMHKEDGVVVCDSDRCVGCWTCIMVCPYGAIRRADLQGKKLIFKCDFCQGSETPACVAHCPNEALVLVEEE
ncbi:4Fe-4S dicluster domain-containing protein [Candidatus Bathyarchaeota archaeon]|nr:4Fe-4S dicluster domain-containing protein [Candidatus Bathyarchaeota archaeon]